MAPGVYSLPGVRTSFFRRLWIAHLTAGLHSVVSHETAAGLAHLTGFPLSTVVLIVDHPQHPRVAGAFVHQISDLQPRWTWSIDGLPVTVTARTIVDLAAVCSRARLDVVLEDAVACRKVTEAQVAQCLFEVLRPGKRGLDRLIDVLESRGEAHVPPMSELERRLFAALDADGLPEPVRQYPHPNRGSFVGIVDAAYTDAKLILEADGRTWHDRKAAFRTDRRRDNEAARVGWQTLRFPWEEIVHDPEDTAATVRDVRAQRLSRV